MTKDCVHIYGLKLITELRYKKHYMYDICFSSRKQNGISNPAFNEINFFNYCPYCGIKLIENEVKND